MTDSIAARFPADFLWGAATASYQIEGAHDEDGRAPSVWDTFSRTPGRVVNGDTGDLACDFYHRYPQDVQMMTELGLHAFRFSIAWPRVIPGGRGAVNEKGLDFYDRLVDELLANGIQPFPTLFHWDLPQVLEDEGGWTARSTVDAFCEYVEAVVGRLGDRIGHWATHNEPWVHAWLGYGSGTFGPEMHAPGRSTQREGLAAAHHLLLGHGRAIEILRREGQPDAQLGIVLNLGKSYPARPDNEADRIAAWMSEGGANRWFLDPVYKGEYPAEMVEYFGSDMPEIHDGDMETIAAPIDWLGINNYFRMVVQATEDGGGMPVRTENEYTAMGFPWEVFPDGLHDLLVQVNRDYAPSCIYITENGAAFDDYRQHDGSVKDPERVAYLQGYIDGVGRAVEAGVPIAGYFVWSLLDNFEWARGYSRRFGIVFVDYPTLERVPKSSALWYRDLIAAHRDRVSAASVGSSTE
jgi:beta-glucosidase